MNCYQNRDIMIGD